MTTGPYLRVGQPDVHPSKPSHVAGVHQGNKPGRTWREGGINLDGDWIKLPFVLAKGKCVHLSVEGRIFEEHSLTLAWLLT